MKKIIPAIFSMLFAAPLSANWEGAGNAPFDDSGRVIISFKAGVSMPSAKMKNDLGNMSLSYYMYDGGLYIEPTCDGNDANCEFIGEANIGKFSIGKKYDNLAFAGGASVGFVMEGRPSLRFELDWLRISESNYNVNPLFVGSTDVEYTENGVPVQATVENNIGAANTSISTDVVSAMFYYDFFAGRREFAKLIPYVGLGFGYATSTTVLMLTDTSGELSSDISLEGFGGQIEGLPLLDFYTSETTTNNFALSGAVGLAYNLDTGVYFDLGARASFVPKIRWALNNKAVISDDSSVSAKERNIFSANDILFLNVYAGLRFEF